MRAITVSFGLGLLLFTVGPVVGCKDKADSGPSANKKLQAAAKPYVGVYKITSRTRKLGSCDAEGKSMLEKDSEGFIAMSLKPSLVGKVLWLTSCKDVANCKQRVAKPAGADFLHTFSYLKGKIISGMEAFTGFARGGKVCKRGRMARLTLVTEGGGVKIELRATNVDYPVDDQGHCDTRKAKQHAKGKPCNEYIVLRAKPVTDL